LVLNLSSELVYVSIQYFKELCFNKPLCFAASQLKKACDFYSAKSFNLFCLRTMFFKRGANIRFIFVSPNFSQSFFSISFQKLKAILLSNCFFIKQLASFLFALIPFVFKRGANIRFIFISPNFSQSFFILFLFRASEWGRKFPMLLFRRHQVVCAVIACFTNRCRSDFCGSGGYTVCMALCYLLMDPFVTMVPN
jgi:hypothetical protein